MSRDVAIQASAKLSGDWSAPDYAKSLTKEVLQELLPRFPKLDPLVCMRLLLSVMSLPAETRASMEQELQALSAAVKLDKEEWVGVIGRAVGSFDGRLDLDAVVKGSSAVRETLKDLRLRADSGKTAGMWPLEEMYLSRRLQAAARGGEAENTGHSHFKLREGVASASAALAQPAANAEAAVNLASAAAVHAAAASAPSPPRADAAGPSHRHPSATAAHSIGARSGGMGDMFRSLRPEHVSMKRPAPGSAASAGGSERGDRKGMQRAAKAKLIDVHEVIALQQQSLPHAHSAAHSASQASESGERGAAGMGNGGPGHMQEPEEDLEEGEVAEEGELPMQGAKRHRLQGPSTAQQPYRDRGPYNPPPPFSPQRHQEGYVSPGHTRRYESYNGGHQRSAWHDLDAVQQDAANHRKQHDTT